MSAAVQDHPAGRATHALISAKRYLSAALANYSPHDSIYTLAQVVAELLDAAAEDVAATYQSYDEVLANNALLLAGNIQRDKDLLAMERLDTARVLMIADLKTRLSRAAEEVEALYRLTNHEVGDATERHLVVTRARTMLDLATPLPPRLSGLTPVSQSTNGAPRAAATH
jgi:hypothetical protein